MDDLIEFLLKNGFVQTYDFSCADKTPCNSYRKYNTTIRIINIGNHNEHCYILFNGGIDSIRFNPTYFDFVRAMYEFQNKGEKIEQNIILINESDYNTYLKVKSVINNENYGK